MLLTFNRQLDRLTANGSLVQRQSFNLATWLHRGQRTSPGPTFHPQLGQVTIHGARGKNAELAELPVPARYDANVPALATARHTMAYSVAHAYAHLRADLTEGTHTVPDFTHAVRHHRLLDHVQQAAITGERQHVSS